MPSAAPASSARRRRFGAALGLVAVAFLAFVGPLAAPVAAAGPTLEARALLDGHGRTGAWLAIEATLANDAEPVKGELRLAAGTQGRTRFGTAVDLPTNSRKTYTLYVQPPVFGQSLELTLVAGERVLARTKVAFTVHDPTQLLVGVVAERPGDVVAGIRLLPSPSGQGSAIVPLAADDLPESVQAWGALDRLVWQDVDTASLSPKQLDAMRGWLAAGGRLTVVGGTAGPRVLAGLPDEILPFRPTATIDVPPDALAGFLGGLPDDASPVPALAGELARGRPLATVGDRTIAAEASYGSGSVTVVGVDPSVGWIGRTEAGERLWQRLLPTRSGVSSPIMSDDSQLVSALSNLPSLALPPIGGLLLLLVGYIVLIGPLNYLVLRRRDRREWAWVTMPLLIVVFAVGSYGFGSALRGTDLIVNEVTIVRGAPDATEGVAQAYLGVFSPTRSTYQVEVGGGALLSAPLSVDQFGGMDAGSALDILQGESARVRDLSVGYGAMRSIRAELAVAVPRVSSDLRLDGDRLVGTVTNLSDRPLGRATVVLGSNATVLGDLAPGEARKVTLELVGNQFGQSLSDQILGQVFFGDPNQNGQDTQQLIVRRSMIDQLTWDPFWGSTGQLPADGPVLLAWGAGGIVDVQVEGVEARRMGNTLYYVPLVMRTEGHAVFRSDLVRSTVVESDAGFFNKDPFNLNFGQGTLTVSYRPIPFTGSLTADRLVLAMNMGGPQMPANIATTDVEPLGPVSEQPPTEDQPAVQFDGLPVVELFDLRSVDWVRLPKLQGGQAYSVADPARYVDPATGQVLVRFRNDRAEGVGFQFGVRIDGDIR